MKKFLIYFAPFVLSACLFSTPNSRFYLLESLPQKYIPSPKKIDIAVYDVLVPDYLQKPQIVLQQKNTPQLKISEFNRWASGLETMIQNTLIEDLQKSFPNATVKPLIFGTKANYIVKLNIEKMTGYFKENAVLSGTWQITSSDGTILKQSDFKFQTDTGKTYASYVQAQSKLISELAQELAQNIAQP